MESLIQLRKLIRAQILHEIVTVSNFPNSNSLKLLCENDKHEKHIDTELLNFQAEFKNIALANKHPYIKYYLKTAIDDLKKTIKARRYKKLGTDELFL
ncbi:MAG: hypothetical protein H0U27_12795 [Nitrosopumilus sp.]|nr:hypothetical protein [Nitrosopumilus sp.]